MGISEIVVKPFSMEQLHNILEGHQSFGELMSQLPKRDGVSEEVEVQEQDDGFTKIKIDEFFSAGSVLFDIFIKLAANRYVKILHSGDKFDDERINKYKNEKGVEYLYFRSKDRKKMIQFFNHLSKKITENDVIQTSTKINFLKNMTTQYIEEVYTEGLKPQVVEQGKEVCETVYKVIEKQDDLYALLRDYQNFDPSAFTHSYLVTLFASCIIKQFEWQSKTTIETTAMACMLHDIGKIKLPEELISKDKKDFTDEDWAMYKQHPILGSEILESIPSVNFAIKQIILQHHEAYNGTGYPYGIRGGRILTLANIVKVADDFVHMIDSKEETPVVCLRKLIMDQEAVRQYNSLIIENFIKVFADPGKLTKDNDMPSNSKMVPNKKAS